MTIVEELNESLLTDYPHFSGWEPVCGSLELNGTLLGVPVRLSHEDVLRELGKSFNALRYFAARTLLADQMLLSPSRQVRRIA